MREYDISFDKEGEWILYETFGISFVSAPVVCITETFTTSGWQIWNARHPRMMHEDDISFEEEGKMILYELKKRDVKMRKSAWKFYFTGEKKIFFRPVVAGDEKLDPFRWRKVRMSRAPQLSTFRCFFQKKIHVHMLADPRTEIGNQSSPLRLPRPTL